MFIKIVKFLEFLHI